MRSVRRKLVFISPSRMRSGAMRATVIEAKSLVERGHEVRILCRQRPESLRQKLRSTVKTVMYRGTPDWICKFPGPVGHFEDIEECQFADGEIIIGVGIWACHQLATRVTVRNPKLQYIHGADEWESEVMERTLQSPIPKVVVSRYLKSMVEARGGSQVLAVIPNGVDRDEYYPVDGVSRNGVGTAFSWSPMKDPQTVTQTLKMLRLTRPDLPLRVFSSDRRPREIAGNSYWRFPTIAKARELYSESLVWFLGSRSEGFSIPVLEAMACGCAVVATDCGGPQDIIEDGTNGFLVQTGNVEQIVEKVLLLLDNESLRKDMTRAALATLPRFSWDKTVDQLEAALARVTGSGSA